MERNWAGNLEYSAAVVARPTSLDELRHLVIGADQIGVLGTRHSFNGIADSAQLVSLDALPAHVVVDHDAGTVELNPATTYGRLAEALHHEGLALPNLASLPHISVGGSVATGTHGSGDALGNLASSVVALEVLRSDGNVVRLRRGDPDFAGAVVGLGALGAVVRLTLEVEPEFQVAQRVYEGLAWDQLAAHFDEVTGAGYSVSLFTTWGEHIEQVWVKRRDAHGRDDLFGARAATVDVHPIAGMSAENCTPQLGVLGRWSDRLPHFKMGFTPSSGDELQSELLMPRSVALDAIAVMRGFASELVPHLQISEIRTVAADELWMSPQHGRDTVAFHFTWRPHTEAVMALVAKIEAALAPFEPRPHWGKLFTVEPATIADRYPRHADFVDLVHRFDERQAFRNPWLDQLVR